MNYIAKGTFEGVEHSFIVNDLDSFMKASDAYGMFGYYTDENGDERLRSLTKGDIVEWLSIRPVGE